MAGINIQGQEREVIIYSMTWKDLDASEDQLKFFFSPNRLNVALTRAKVKRIVLANENLFAEPKDSLLVSESMQLLIDFLNNSDKIVSYP